MYEKEFGPSPALIARVPLEVQTAEPAPPAVV